jgi:hypothetical protein
MTKRIHILFFVVLLATACATEKMNPESPWTKDPGDDDSPILFLSETDPYAWSHTIGLDERFKACRVPEDILDSKTTRALGLSILHYPLNGIIYAYNYWDMPVKTIYDKSPLHQALVAREDAATVLIDIFERTSIDFSIYVSKDYESITLSDEVFLELFLGTGLVPGMDSKANKERLKTIVSRKTTERMVDRSSSDNSLIPLAYMNERLGLGLSFDNDIIDRMHLFTLGDRLFNE